ncbi:MAG: hypothetical protein KJO98_13715 [Rhodothermia bacterium]|nr:hypothetical protein [Rhodothermia bacterium]
MTDTRAEDQRMVSSNSLEIRFGSSPLVIESIRSARGQIICAGGSQEFLLRVEGQVSEPIFLRRVLSFDLESDKVAFVLTDDEGRYEVAAEIAVSEEGLRSSFRATGPAPIWLIEWRLAGLDLSEVLIPALGGQAVTSAMPNGERLSYKYPFWWNAQFAIGMTGEDSGIWLRTLDKDPHFKLLRVGREESTFDLTLGFEADGPLTVGVLSGEFFLDAFAGSWKVPVDRHREWLEHEFNLVPYARHPSYPSWMNDISLVLELWGMRRDRGRPAHRFDDMCRRVEQFASQHPPSQTLLYLPGFAGGGIDSGIPDYSPATKLGGATGFARLIDTAHRLGYRVMIHTNVLGMTFNHPLFKRFEQHQVVDVFGREQGWGLDLDGDWLAEPYFAYINPGVPEWGELIADVLTEFVSAYRVDAVFIDQTLLAFNVSRGPNFISGMRTHIERLQQSFPATLFAGEGINEHVLPALPVVQIHGIDSVADVHGMDDHVPWRYVHPVSTYLFGPHTRFLPHLLTKHPSNPVFKKQEAAYADLGVIPTIVCYEADDALSGPEIDVVLKRARQLPETAITSTT